MQFSKALQKPVAAHSGKMSAHLGLIVHVQDDNSSPYGYFSRIKNEASSTIWVSKTGQLEQYVDADYIAWAQATGNATYNSAETEGKPDELMTDAQLDTLAQVYVEGHVFYNWPVLLADKPGDKGLGWHGMGAPAWGHALCPGNLRKSQRIDILTRVSQILTPTTLQEASKMVGKQAVALKSTKSGKGYWIVAADGGVYSFGDAVFYGGMGDHHLNAQIVNMEVAPDGLGYWLVGVDGGVFGFGTAAYYKTSDGKDTHEFFQVS